MALIFSTFHWPSVEASGWRGPFLLFPPSPSSLLRPNLFSSSFPFPHSSSVLPPSPGVLPLCVKDID